MKRFETHAMERHRKWPCLKSWPYWIHLAVQHLSLSLLVVREDILRGVKYSKKVFFEKNPSLHCTQEVVTILHFFPLSWAETFLRGVKYSEKLFLEKCPSLQVAEVVAILHIFSSPLPTAQKSIQSCQKLMDFLFTALLCSQFKILFMRLEIFSRSMYPPVQTCIHSVLMWSCTSMWSWYDPFFHGSGGVGWTGVKVKLIFHQKYA